MFGSISSLGLWCLDRSLCHLYLSWCEILNVRTYLCSSNIYLWRRSPFPAMLKWQYPPLFQRSIQQQRHSRADLLRICIVHLSNHQTGLCSVQRQTQILEKANRQTKEMEIGCPDVRHPLMGFSHQIFTRFLALYRLELTHIFADYYVLFLIFGVGIFRYSSIQSH